MADTTKRRTGQAQGTTTPGIEATASELKTDRDELIESSQQFFRTLFRTGVHLAMTPVTMLPEEPREHFVTAGREFSRGLASMAQELAGVFDKMAQEVRESRDAALQNVSTPTDESRTID